MRIRLFWIAVLAAVTATALFSTSGALAGGKRSASITVSTKLVPCNDPVTGDPTKCWGALSGSGLFAQSDVSLYVDGVDVFDWFAADDGTLSSTPRIFCSETHATSAYATGIDGLGNPVQSKVVRPRC
jgi:hypothetical protein